MATVLNRSTKAVLRSVNTPEYPESGWIINPDLSAVEGYDAKYWTLNGDAVELMTQAERDAVDAAEQAAIDAATKAAAKGAVDQTNDPSTRVLIGMAKIIQAELQTNKAAIQQIADHLGITLNVPLRPSASIDQYREVLKGLIDNG